MAKRKTGGTQTAATTATIQSSGTAMTADVMEQRVVAFAEQLGRIVGTVQARAEGWMDREALNKQIASVRDSASELLDQLKTTVSKATAATKTTANAMSTKKARQEAPETHAKGSARRGRGREGVEHSLGQDHDQDGQAARARVDT